MSFREEPQTMKARYAVFLEPLDVLLFKDHRPFDAGEHFSASSVFPAASVVLGALRTGLVERLGGDFHSPEFGLKGVRKDLVGTKNVQSKISLLGPFLAERRAEGIVPLLPPPAHVELQETNEGKVHGVLRRSPRALKSAKVGLKVRSFEAGASGNFSDKELPWSDRLLKKATSTRWLLRPEGVDALFQDSKGDEIPLEEESAVIAPHQVFQEEPRVGIARNPGTLTVEDGMFFSLRPWRFARNFGLAVEIEVSAEKDGSGVSQADCFEQLHGQTIHLGGKGHQARVHVYRGDLFPDRYFPTKEGASFGCLLWLLQPLEATTCCLLQEASCQVLPSPVMLGGWDMAKASPRPLKRALAEGSVFWFNNPDWSRLWECLTRPLAEGAARLHRPAAFLSPWIQ